MIVYLTGQLTAPESKPVKLVSSTSNDAHAENAEIPLAELFRLPTPSSNKHRPAPFNSDTNAVGTVDLPTSGTDFLDISQDVASLLSASGSFIGRNAMRVKEVTVVGTVGRVSVMAMTFKSRKMAHQKFHASLYPMRHDMWPNSSHSSQVDSINLKNIFQLVNCDAGTVTVEFDPSHIGIYTAVLVVCCGQKVRFIAALLISLMICAELYPFASW